MFFGPPTDCDDDGDVTDEHDDDGEDPGEDEEVEEVEKLMILVCECDCVDALPVGGDDWVSLQTEDDGLRYGADGRQGPAEEEQEAGPAA